MNMITSNNEKDSNKKTKFGLFSRMLLALFVLVVSTIFLLSISLLKNAVNQFNEFKLEHVQSMAYTLANGSLDALITEDYELLERFIKSSLPPHNGAYVYLTRPNGLILSSTDTDLIAKKIILPTIDGTKISRALTYKNRPIIEVIVKTYVGKKYIANAHISYYTDEENFSYFGQAKETIFALVSILIVILAGTYFIVSRIRTPVLQLIDSVINTSHEAPINLPPQMHWRNDEVGTLARSFDDVFNRLSSANKEINETKNSLEIKVKERTKQLTEKNMELEITKERINAIMDNAADSIISIDENGLIQSFNIAAQILFGYSSEEVCSKNINILMPEPYHSSHDGYIKRYRETGVPHIIGKSGREVTGKRKDNTEFPIELLVNHINLHGETLYIGIVRDITLQNAAKESLIKSNELLEEKVNERTLELKNINKDLVVARDAALDASKIKSEFLSTISHELRTPLHAITGYENLLAMTKLSETQSKYCNNIDKGAKHLLEIINEILDFSAFEAGEMKIENKVFSITETLAEICEMFKFKAKQKGLNLSYHINEDVPHIIYTDPKRLRQTIVNLIGNALKFTEKGSISINVNIPTSEEKSNINYIPKISINVTDTGIGIEKTELEKVFSPFYQVDGSMIRTQGGTGLGLAISKKIIELMGGKISLESHINEGCTFTITLPLLTNEKDSTGFQKSKNTPIKTTGNFEKKASNLNKKIIIVEDDETNAELLSLMVEHIGYHSDIAENGKVFLDMMKKNKYDLILMDCHMPILDGYSATKQYRKLADNEKHIPIIAVTANAMEGDKEKCLASGMDDHIAKPVSPNLLKKVIYHWINTEINQAI